MPETPQRSASNLPPLSLHIPEPRYRPGDTPDFSDVPVPAVDATPRPGEATKPAATRPAKASFFIICLLRYPGLLIRPVTLRRLAAKRSASKQK